MAGMSDLDQRAEEVRAFNRFYTQSIGALNPGLLDSAFSLTEARVLYELAHQERPTSVAIARELDLDAGYLSRIVTKFQKRGLLSRRRSETDRRESLLALTTKGRREVAALDRRSHDEMAARLKPLSPADRARLTASLSTVQVLLGGGAKDTAPFIIRTHRPGDLGWIVQRHGEIYHEEYGWDEKFEGLVAGIAADFARDFDPERERCWIAERAGERIGSIVLVRKSATVAKLRLLLVEPSARGLGLGQHLVQECIRFARECGYRKLILWTNSVLDAARHIYEKAGFALVEEEKHNQFGHGLVGQGWELRL
jgi:DNA-binding MarR family transcriptional regulator/GNAT superfamily N-acetyltransferase